MSVPNLNPDDLELPDLPDSILESKGPVIDSSDEFPLPAWDFDDDLAGADVLFPEGIEPTAEEIPAGKPVERVTDPLAGQTHELSLPSTALPGPEGEAEAEFSFFPPDDRSLDDDYFQEGLDPEPPSTPSPGSSPSDNPTLKVVELPLPKVAWDKAGSHLKDQARVPTPPAAPSMDPRSVAIPSVSLEPQGGADFIRPLRRDSWTLPEIPPTSVPPSFSPDTASPVEPPSSVAMPPSERMLETVIEFEPETVVVPIQETPRSKSKNAPVEQYVQKMAGKRMEAPAKRTVRPWIPAVGVAALVLGYFVSPPLFDRIVAPNLDVPVMVVGSVPQGEVYAGDTLLGTSPMALNAETAARDDLQVRKAGYQPLDVPAYKADGGGADKLLTFTKPLSVKPVKVAWDGLPQGAEVWWNGKKADIAKIATVKPGTYSVKAKTKSRPAVTLDLKVAPGAEKPLAAGQAIRGAFDKQPKASINFKAPNKGSSGKAVTFYVESVGGGSPFSTEVKGKAGSASSVYLPRAGKYRVSFDGDGRFKAVSKSFEAKASSSDKLELSLTEQPPVATVSQQPSSSSGSGYSQPTYYQPSYSPPPAYYPSSGGGGGGGRIAPPAF